MDRDHLLTELDRTGAVMMTYRLITEAGPIYHSMKVSLMEDDNRFLVIGIADVDEEIKQRREVERVKEEKIAYDRIRALAGDFVSIFSVEPTSGRYRKFTASSSFEDAISSKEGADFFADCIRQAKRQIHPDDVNRFLDVITKDNVLAEVEAHGVFSVSYRLMRGGAPRYVQLRAATVEDADGYTLIIGINDIDSQVKQEEEYKKRIAQAQREANQDVLTGVKNRHAYLEAEERLDQQIAEHREGDFAVVILDVNDLKLINDTEGHKAGDQYLKDASSIIAGIFKNSTIYRVGGDEFCTIVQDMDYERIDDLLKDMEDHNARAIRTGGVVIACGMAKYEGDTNAAAVFERADQNMYQNKSDLKEGRAVR
jgi:diguanylate cyclase (GGDEF)-like protein